MKSHTAVVQRLAANRLAHLVVRDIGDLLAVNPDLDALAADIEAELVPVLAVDLQSLSVGQLALAVAAGIAIAGRDPAIVVVGAGQGPGAVALHGKRIHAGAALRASSPSYGK